MTLDEFVQREIDSGRIHSTDSFYIGLCFLRLDNGKKLNKDDYENYLEYKLKMVTTQIDFDSMGRYNVWYEIELRAEENKE